MTANSTMTDRHHRILASLVAEYIEQGEPVSSAWLAENSALGLSSATVRNILARLEDQGLVRQPHTSSGRIPTDHGYRQYVDELLESRRPPRPVRDLEARLRRSATVGDLLAHASQELSRASHQVGFALAPASSSLRLKHIDFVGLDGCRVLVIIVATGGQVTHRAIETAERYDATTLQQAANYVNAELAGLTLDEARTAIVTRLREERQLYDALMRRALVLAQSGLHEVAPEETLHVQGTSFLVEELRSETDGRQEALETLRVLLRMIEEKHRLVELLTRSLETPGLTVLIGEESGSPELRPFSVVLSTFQDGDRLSTIGIIGPTRMRYQRAISVVDGVSHTVARLFEGQ
ncbi:MAG: heat-inducible transcription repressor HrcA [Acidobacteria bacterium SCN 69-37]|nr:MAG: heat-inducible transcription repressor HrcA [Acidobacteria bacterium SCN 69-37]